MLSNTLRISLTRVVLATSRVTCVTHMNRLLSRMVSARECSLSARKVKKSVRTSSTRSWAHRLTQLCLLMTNFLRKVFSRILNSRLRLRSSSSHLVNWSSMTSSITTAKFLMIRATQTNGRKPFCGGVKLVRKMPKS